MPSAVEKIRKAALELSQKQRAALAYDLLRSVDDEGDDDDDPKAVAEAWDQEVEHRVKALRSGEMKAIPWEEAEASLRKTLARRRRR